MLWRWFHDWRDRRAALAEVDRLRRTDEATLMDQDQNPLKLAKSALLSDPEEAAAQWERARRLVPRAVLDSPDSLDILLGLNRLDEAEALMRERQKHSPRDRFCLTALARIAEQRGDIAEAVRRWKVVASRVLDTPEGSLGYARCLARLGRFDEAETQLDRAWRHDPGSHDVRVARAVICDQRGDWARSVERWKDQAETHNDVPAYASAAKAMLELGRIDEAEAWLAAPARNFPSNFDIAVTRCLTAQRRGDLTAACERWATVRAVNPFFDAAYREGANRLCEAGRHTEADEVMRKAIERFPDEVWPLLNFARLAHDRRDWSEAVPRWEALRRRFPDEAAGYSMAAEALRALGRDDEAAAFRHQQP